MSGSNGKKDYDPEVELAKGATLEAVSYDKTQKIKVFSSKVTVGGKLGRVEITGIATGRCDGGVGGTLGIWLSIFGYMHPDGVIDYVAGWDIMISLAAGQTPIATAKAFATHINSCPRPYKAVVVWTPAAATIAIIFTGKYGEGNDV